MKVSFCLTILAAVVLVAQTAPVPVPGNQVQSLVSSSAVNVVSKRNIDSLQKRTPPTAEDGNGEGKEQTKTKQSEGSEVDDDEVDDGSPEPEGVVSNEPALDRRDDDDYDAPGGYSATVSGEPALERRTAGPMGSARGGDDDYDAPGSYSATVSGEPALERRRDEDTDYEDDVSRPPKKAKRAAVPGDDDDEDDDVGDEGSSDAQSASTEPALEQRAEYDTPLRPEDSTLDRRTYLGGDDDRDDDTAQSVSLKPVLERRRDEDTDYEDDVSRPPKKAKRAGVPVADADDDDDIDDEGSSDAQSVGTEPALEQRAEYDTPLRPEDATPDRR